MVRQLRQHKLATTVLTGDRVQAASTMIGSIEVIGVVHSELSPQQKLGSIRSWREKSSLPMVGDVISDAPGLATATAGVTCGSSNATAVYARPCWPIAISWTSPDWSRGPARQRGSSRRTLRWSSHF